MDILKEKIQLTLGDGSEWELSYEPSPYDLDFNVSEFRFLQTEGVYIDRATIGARRFEAVLYFTDESHLQTYKSFENSCRNSKHWVVNHPYNGRMNMQPLSISFNPTPLHTTVTVSLAETMTEEGILIHDDFRSNINEKSRMTNESAMDRASEIDSNTSDINAVADSSIAISDNLQNKIDFQDVATDYMSELNKLKNYSSTTVDLMRSTQNQIMMPIDFINNIKDTVSFLELQFNTVKDIITSSVLAYEFLGASIISALSLGVVPNDNAEYSNTKDIDESVNSLLTIYNEYIATIQAHQNTDGYVMNYELFYALHDLVVFTINHLYDIAVDAPLIVSDVVTHDTNPVILAHDYIMNISDLFIINDWSVKQTLFIESGTRFNYYIS